MTRSTSAPVTTSSSRVALGPTTSAFRRRPRVVVRRFGVFTGGFLRRPLAEQPPVTLAGSHLDRDEAAGVVPLVQSEAAHARDLGVEPGVMVAEEAHARARLREQLVEPGRLAEEALAAPVALEAHAGRSVVREDDVEPTALAQRSDLVAGVVTLRVALQRLRRALEVRRAVAPADAADAQRIAARDELVDLAVLQVVQAGQHLGRRLRVEPDEVLMVALDEHRFARGGAPFSD